jgi:hypothetical protein
MNNLNKFYNDIVTPNLGVTGVGGDPLYKVIEESYMLLCDRDPQASSDELLNDVTIMMASFKKHVNEDMWRGGRSIQEYLIKIAEIEHALHDFCNAASCPLDEVPLYINSSPAAKIAARRLADAE